MANSDLESEMSVLQEKEQEYKDTNGGLLKQVQGYKDTNGGLLKQVAALNLELLAEKAEVLLLKQKVTKLQDDLKKAPFNV